MIIILFQSKRKRITRLANVRFSRIGSFLLEIALLFIEDFDWAPVEHPLLKAELYREAGKMQECTDVLKTISYESMQDFEKNIYNSIKKRMENNDNKVFKLSI